MRRADLMEMLNMLMYIKFGGCQNVNSKKVGFFFLV